MGVKNQDLGPGTYNPPAYGKSFANAKRANTAAFCSTRKDMFTGSNNPGPTSYSLNTSMTTKNWSTNIGAFGTTEKKFSELGNNDQRPGPGQYRTVSMGQKKFTTKKVRGQKVKIRNTTNSSFF